MTSKYHRETCHWFHCFEGRRTRGQSRNGRSLRSGWNSQPHGACREDKERSAILRATSLPPSFVRTPDDRYFSFIYKFHPILRSFPLSFIMLFSRYIQIEETGSSTRGVRCHEGNFYTQRQLLSEIHFYSNFFSFSFASTGQGCGLFLRQVRHICQANRGISQGHPGRKDSNINPRKLSKLWEKKHKAQKNTLEGFQCAHSIDTIHEDSPFSQKSHMTWKFYIHKLWLKDSGIKVVEPAATIYFSISLQSLFVVLQSFQHSIILSQQASAILIFVAEKIGNYWTIVIQNT